jgi:hypothetical protein
LILCEWIFVRACPKSELLEHPYNLMEQKECKKAGKAVRSKKAHSK